MFLVIKYYYNVLIFSDIDVQFGNNEIGILT